MDRTPPFSQAAKDNEETETTDSLALASSPAVNKERFASWRQLCIITIACSVLLRSDLVSIMSFTSWFKVDALKDLSEKVQGSMPKLDMEVLEKLTLTSPDLVAERERIDTEERRKEQVKNMVSLLPWETKDPERDILVEECKDAILKLSSDRQTFSGPFSLPKLAVNLGAIEATKSEEGEEVAEGEKEEEMESPTNETLEKLAALGPLPPLLHDFELDAHVGLIQKLLAIDPILVHMQSSLSGGGQHEKIFWKNYFFHCAWCRYEAGLGIDEIWSVHTTTQPAEFDHDHGENPGEETITFEEHDVSQSSIKVFPQDPVVDANAPFNGEGTVNVQPAAPHEVRSATGTPANASEAADFELVGEAELAGPLQDEDVVDYELDELEAEIARELED